MSVPAPFDTLRFLEERDLAIIVNAIEHNDNSEITIIVNVIKQPSFDKNGAKMSLKSKY